MRAILADLAYGLRLLRNSRGFALITIGTLALGIGVTTAMFSVVDGVLLKPFPVKDQDRLLVVWTSIPKQGFESLAVLVHVVRGHARAAAHGQRCRRASVCGRAADGPPLRRWVGDAAATRGRHG